MRGWRTSEMTCEVGVDPPPAKVSVGSVGVVVASEYEAPAAVVVRADVSENTLITAVHSRSASAKLAAPSTAEASAMVFRFAAVSELAAVSVNVATWRYCEARGVWALMG